MKTTDKKHGKNAISYSLGSGNRSGLSARNRTHQVVHGLEEMRTALQKTENEIGHTIILIKIGDLVCWNAGKVLHQGGKLPQLLFYGKSRRFVGFWACRKAWCADVFKTLDSIIARLPQ